MMTNLYGSGKPGAGSNCHYYRHGVHAGRKRMHQCNRGQKPSPCVHDHIVWCDQEGSWIPCGRKHKRTEARFGTWIATCGN